MNLSDKPVKQLMDSHHRISFIKKILVKMDENYSDETDLWARIKEREEKSRRK